MNESETQLIKEELYSLYKTSLKNLDSKIDLSQIPDISSFTNISLIFDLKKNFLKIITSNKILKDNISQLENTNKKLEFDLKYYIKNLFHYKIQNNSFELKIKAFTSMEEDYEELKEKVRYEGGKFLENDRKDNEIMILRNENSKIKKEIRKLESQKVILTSEKKDLEEKVKELENDIDKLNQKITDMEKNWKENKFNSSGNIKLNSKDNKDNIVNKKLKRNNFSISNLQNIINFTNNGTINNSNKKLVSFLSPKDDMLYFEHSRNKYNNKSSVNTNLFTATYNKIVHGTNINKLIFPFKKDFTVIKYTRNKSLSNIKGREYNESKTMSFNSNYINKSENKQKAFNKIINTKQQNGMIVNSNEFKNVGNIDKKYVNNNFNRITSAKNNKNNKNK